MWILLYSSTTSVCCLWCAGRISLKLFHISLWLFLIRGNLFCIQLLQNRIGADIIMALDDVVRTTITGPRIEEAMYRTLRWIDRCIAGNDSLQHVIRIFNSIFVCMQQTAIQSCLGNNKILFPCRNSKSIRLRLISQLSM